MLGANWCNQRTIMKKKTTARKASRDFNHRKNKGQKVSLLLSHLRLFWCFINTVAWTPSSVMPDAKSKLHIKNKYDNQRTVRYKIGTHILRVCSIRSQCLGSTGKPTKLTAFSRVHPHGAIWGLQMLSKMKGRGEVNCVTRSHPARKAKSEHWARLADRIHQWPQQYSIESFRKTRFECSVRKIENNPRRCEMDSFNHKGSPKLNVLFTPNWNENQLPEGLRKKFWETEKKQVTSAGSVIATATDCSTGIGDRDDCFNRGWTRRREREERERCEFERDENEDDEWFEGMAVPNEDEERAGMEFESESESDCECERVEWVEKMERSDCEPWAKLRELLWRLDVWSWLLLSRFPLSFNLRRVVKDACDELACSSAFTWPILVPVAIDWRKRVACKRDMRGERASLVD